jgi:hypothetical protein
VAFEAALGLLDAVEMESDEGDELESEADSDDGTADGSPET